MLLVGRKRQLGEPPCDGDLSSGVFMFGTKFGSNECVLVPRSRGGFVYGKVTKQIKKKNCFYDASNPHSYIEWRIEYPDISGRPLFKQLPSNLLGSLPKNINTVSKLSTTQNRELGAYASQRDLSNVAFNNLHKFSVGEKVLVPRSSGGFTYGEILSPVAVSCFLALHKEERHNVNGWRIALDKEKSMKKELVNGSIGKLPLCGAQLEVPPLVTLDKPSRSRNRKKKPKKNGKRDFTKRFDKMASSLTPASEVGTIPPNQDLSTETKKELSPGNVSPEESSEYETSEEIDEEEEEEEEDEESDSEEIFLKPSVVENSDSDKVSKVEEEEEDEDEEEVFIAPRGVITLTGPVANNTSRYNVPQAKPKCVVVLDAPNIAMKHGKKQFSAKGIRICAEYWKQRGHEVIAFLPEHYVSKKPTAGNTMTLSEYMPKVDNMAIIETLEKKNILFYTPPQDYDDSYCIEYARTNNGVVVSNDMYRDHIEKTKECDRRKTRNWIRSHCISFTFVKDQFLPNPDFKFPNDCVS